MLQAEIMLRRFREIGVNETDYEAPRLIVLGTADEMTTGQTLGRPDLLLFYRGL